MYLINSLCDTDLYKLTMMQAVFHQYPGVPVKYKFKSRNRKLVLDSKHFNLLKEEIEHYCNLTFTDNELKYLSTLKFMSPDFIDYLSMYKPRFEHVKIERETDGNLAITIEGPWLTTIPFEVPILSMVSEIYSSTTDISPTLRTDFGRNNLNAKIKYIKNAIPVSRTPHLLNIIDMGTRRRMSYQWHDEVIDTLKRRSWFKGTSNVKLAMKHHVIPIGTMAHEWLQAHQQLNCRLANSQKSALESWIKEYHGDLGVALSDVVGFNNFLYDFDSCFANTFKGVRHDSGNPRKWGNKLLNHYESLGINPLTKTAVFSDGLTFQSIVEIFNHFKSRINLTFGIGTNLTNDCGFVSPQIVIKMVECNGQPVAKISDDPGKGMCESPAFDAYIRTVFSH